MKSYEKLLLHNKAWVQDKLQVRSDYFETMAKEQTPEFLWIGCSDSRVPAEEITGTEPGELFVHRNIANLVIHTDFNILSVLQFAVEVLKVKHVIVCGHYDCGGIKNALSHKNLGLINKWLRHIKDIYRIHQRELEELQDDAARYRRLVELNVSEQVNNVAETTIIQKSWHDHRRPSIHGWIYDLQTGYLKAVKTLEPGANLNPIYTYDLD